MLNKTDYIKHQLLAVLQCVCINGNFDIQIKRKELFNFNLYNNI